LLGFLVRASRFPEPPPYRVLGKSDPVRLLHDCLHAFDGPEIGLVSELRSWSQNDLSEFAYRKPLPEVWVVHSQVLDSVLRLLPGDRIEASGAGRAVGPKSFRDQRDLH